MATTDCNLYRSVMDRSFRRIEIGVYPGDGVLYPRWESTQYFSKRFNEWRTSPADVNVVMGTQGPQVEPGGGTSLHDVPGWFPTKEFWIPTGTEYSEEILIRKDAKQKTCPSDPKLKGFHYQLEPRTRMTIDAFKGALDNMARAAVVRQCALANKV